MMRKRDLIPRRNGGYSLLEMLVYIVAFGMAVNILVSLLGTGARLTAITTLGLERMDGVRDVEDTFTRYARQAAGVVDSVATYHTSESQVVLKMPPGNEDGIEYMVLGALKDPDRFAVLGLKPGGSGWEAGYLRTLRQPLARIHFETASTERGTLLHLDVQVKLEEGERERTFLVHRSSVFLRGTGL